jgi:hypothetical protein
VTRSTVIDSTYVKAQRAALGEKRGALAPSDRSLARRLDDPACPEPVEGVHALTDVIGRPDALMLAAGNVRDMEAAPALLERAGCMRYLLATRATTPTGSGARCGTPVPFRSPPAAASEPSATTRNATAAATSSKTPSAASRTYVASPPTTTSSPPTSFQA